MPCCDEVETTEQSRFINEQLASHLISSELTVLNLDSHLSSLAFLLTDQSGLRFEDCYFVCKVRGSILNLHECRRESMDVGVRRIST